MSNYAGESPGKKVARLDWWKKIREAHPGLLTSRIVVLAGPDAGDARVLRGLGADMSRVTMVDMDGAALESARAIVPEARWFHGTDLDAATRMRGTCDVMALDYCRQLNPENVTDFCRVATIGIRNVGGVAACGMSYGREVGAAAEAVDRAKKSAFVLGSDGDRVSDNMKSLRRHARYLVFQNAARAAFGRVGVSFREAAFRFYASEHTPMMYGVGKVRRGPGGYESLSRVAHQKVGHGRHPALDFVEKNRRAVMASMMLGEVPAQHAAAIQSALMGGYESIDLDGADDVRECAIATAREFGSATTADLLALSPEDARRVPAWLAVDTRERRSA